MPPKMTIPFFLMSALPAANLSAQTAPSLAGVWRLTDGSATVRIMQCDGSTDFCAKVIEERLKPGETSSLNQIVVRDLRPKGKASYVGRYIADGQSMKASAKLTGADALTFKFCAMVFLCDTMTLNRQLR
jgi:uncharacterized protein (DUF2147 family)